MTNDKPKRVETLKPIIAHQPASRMKKNVCENDSGVPRVGPLLDLSSETQVGDDQQHDTDYDEKGSQARATQMAVDGRYCDSGDKCDYS